MSNHYCKPGWRLWFTAKERTCNECGARWVYRYGRLDPWGPGGIFTASEGRRWVPAAATRDTK